jgi:hypothetical protein
VVAVLVEDIKDLLAVVVEDITDVVVVVWMQLQRW